MTTDSPALDDAPAVDDAPAAVVGSSRVGAPRASARSPAADRGTHPLGSVVAADSSAPAPVPAAATPRPSARGRSRQLAELTFLQDVARLATSTRTWDELMVTIIDRAKAAARADVCSLYLMDRDGGGVTLAATSGLDRDQLGKARLRLNEGITGRVAAEGRSLVSADVRSDPRFHWVRGVDRDEFTSMCSVPLVWNDRVVGVLNVQTVRKRRFADQDVRFLEALAALLAGVVEKDRLAREAEAQVDSLRGIDEARATLIAVVTHELRTPLAVVRAYLELLGEVARSHEHPQAEEWERAGLEQVERLDRTVDSILASLRVLPSGAPEIGRLDLAEVTSATVDALAPLLRNRSFAATFTERPLPAMGSAEMLRRVLEHLLENAAKYAPRNGKIDVYAWRQNERAYLAVTDDGPGIPRDWRDRIFEPFVRLDDSPRGAGIGLFAARRLARLMGGDLRVEDRLPAGSQFVLELPAPASVVASG